MMKNPPAISEDTSTAAGASKSVSAGEGSGPRNLTAKQREIRQRGPRILDTAFPIICAGGLAAVNMEAIARQMNCTRGTIYNHFSNKEDILLALATRSVRRRMELFRYAVTLGRHARECCAAIGLAAEVYVDCLPDDFAIEQIIRHDPVWQKTSPGRREVLAGCERQCIECLGKVIEQAVAEDDLVVPADSLESLIPRLVFGLWSLVYGGLVLESTSPSLALSGISNPRSTIRRNCNALLDEVGWQPLFDPESYAATVSRITPLLQQHVEIVCNQTLEESSQ